MARTPSTMLALGTEAPGFALPDATGKTVKLEDFAKSRALVVMFICNHCPFVKLLADEISQVARDFEGKGVGFVGINSNDIANYPEDGPEKMIEESQLRGYTFPYLLDETQEVAKAYQAACTPDFYVFDEERKLTYRGQFDEARPGNEQAVTGADLRQAIESTLTQKSVSEDDQKPSIGCNIKWKAGNAPSYF